MDGNESDSGVVGARRFAHENSGSWTAVVTRMSSTCGG